jgi:hypothetical protein
MGQHPFQLGAIGVRKGEEAVVDLQRDFADNQRPVLEQEVIGLEDATGLRILYGDEREINRLIGDAMEDMPQRSERLGRRRRKRGVQRLFGVGTRFPLIADRDLASDSATLIPSWNEPGERHRDPRAKGAGRRL